MTINFGSSGIGEIYYGSTPIKEVYAGSQLVWSSGPSYPQTGTWAGGTVPYSGNPPTNPLLADTHTIYADGNYTITWSVTYTTANLAQSIIRRDGGLLSSSPSYNFPSTATASWTGDCTAGQVIQFQAVSAGTAGSVASDGAWTITKN